MAGCSGRPGTVGIACCCRVIQNPNDCKVAPKLICRLNNPNGFASNVHDVLWCFVAALQMNRTVILNSSRWHHETPTMPWSSTFQPVAGPSCSHHHADSEKMISGGFTGAASFAWAYERMVRIPSGLLKPLLSNHGQPYSWFYGQIMGYILRLQNSTRQKIEDFKKDVYRHPIVGIHIRRTDKSSEAAYHDVEEYMQHAENFFNRLELTKPNVRRRVFIATDIPKVIKEIKRKFPRYIVISNYRAAKEAFNHTTRRTSLALSNIVLDIHLLAEADRLVCTMSSGFCRVAYELRQALHAAAGLDATWKSVSVDVEYFYAYVPFPPRRTLYLNEHVFNDELEWTLPGGLVYHNKSAAFFEEAKRKKYADGLNIGLYLGENATIFPRFKTTQTYWVKKYKAFNFRRTQVYSKPEIPLELSFQT
ncbi:alpha-(1,6)-fucosyltransferase-like [Haemaphysalis longicornis]